MISSIKFISMTVLSFMNRKAERGNAGIMRFGRNKIDLVIMLLMLAFSFLVPLLIKIFMCFYRLFRF